MTISHVGVLPKKQGDEISGLSYSQLKCNTPIPPPIPPQAENIMELIVEENPKENASHPVVTSK